MKHIALIPFLFILVYSACKKDPPVRPSPDNDPIIEQPDYNEGQSNWLKYVVDSFTTGPSKYNNSIGVYWGNSDIILGYYRDRTLNTNTSGAYLYRMDPASFKVQDAESYSSYFDMFKEIENELYFSVSNDMSTFDGLYKTTGPINNLSPIDCGKITLSKVDSTFYYVNFWHPSALVKGGVGACNNSPYYTSPVSINYIEFANRDTGFFVSGSNLSRTINGGTSWNFYYSFFSNARLKKVRNKIYVIADEICIEIYPKPNNVVYVSNDNPSFAVTDIIENSTGKKFISLSRKDSIGGKILTSVSDFDNSWSESYHSDIMSFTHIACSPGNDNYIIAIGDHTLDFQNKHKKTLVAITTTGGN